MTTRRPPFDWEEVDKLHKIAKQGSEPANSKPKPSTVLDPKDRAALDLEKRLRAIDLAKNTVPEPSRPYEPKIVLDKKTGFYRLKTSTT